MGSINIELTLEPTSLAAPALNVKCHIISTNVKEVELSLGGWNITQSEFKPIFPDLEIRVNKDSMKLLTNKETYEAKFTIVLSPLSNEKILKTNNIIWKIIGDFYPFIASELEIPLIILSSNNEINLVVNLILPSNMIPYGGTWKGFKSETRLGEVSESRMMYSGYAGGKGEINTLFGLTFRFRPFIAFQKAVLPIAIIYATALITQVISGVSSISIQWEIYNITVHSDILFKLLQLLVNTFFFTRISKIPIGIQTRSLLQGLKIISWSFIGLLVLQVSYPHILPVLGINLFDLILKASQLWLVASTIISILIYPYVWKERSRSH